VIFICIILQEVKKLLMKKNSFSFFPLNPNKLNLSLLFMKNNAFISELENLKLKTFLYLYINKRLR
jgi:hypothetical protein